MKTFQQYISEDTIGVLDLGLYELLESEGASTMTSGVDNPDAKPMIKKSSFAGTPCVEVDDETYSQCIQGKQPFKRWKGYVGDEQLRDELRSMYHKNKKLLVMNQKTGSMVYIK